MYKKLIAFLLSVVFLFISFFFLLSTVGFYKPSCPSESTTDIGFENMENDIEINQLINNGLNINYKYYIKNGASYCNKIALKITQDDNELENIINYNPTMDNPGDLHEVYFWDGKLIDPYDVSDYVKTGYITLQIGFKNGMDQWVPEEITKMEIRVYGTNDEDPFEPEKPTIEIISVNNINSGIIRANLKINNPSNNRLIVDYKILEANEENRWCNPIELDNYYGSFSPENLEWGGNILNKTQITIVARVRSYDINDNYEEFYSEPIEVDYSSVYEDKSIYLQYDYLRYFNGDEEVSFPISKLYSKQVDNALSAAGAYLMIYEPNVIDVNNDNECYVTMTKNHCKEFFALHKNPGQKAYICGIHAMKRTDGTIDNAQGVAIASWEAPYGALICAGIEMLGDDPKVIIHEFRHELGGAETECNSTVGQSCCGQWGYTHDIQGNGDNGTFSAQVRLDINPHLCKTCVDLLTYKKYEF